MVKHTGYKHSIQCFLRKVACRVQHTVSAHTGISTVIQRVPDTECMCVSNTLIVCAMFNTLCLHTQNCSQSFTIFQTLNIKVPNTLLCWHSVNRLMHTLQYSEYSAAQIYISQSHVLGLRLVALESALDTLSTTTKPQLTLCHICSFSDT